MHKFVKFYFLLIIYMIYKRAYCIEHKVKNS